MEKIKKQNLHMDLIYQAAENLYDETDEIPKSLKPILRHVKFTTYGKIG